MRDLILKDDFRLTGEVKWIKSKNGVIVAESDWMKNQIVGNDLHGIYLVLDRLASINTYSLNITHADIGDDNTAPTTADTDLGNGLVRTDVAIASRSALQNTFRFFYSDTLTPDDTYEEFGMFIDGASGVGTGQLFNRLLFTSQLVKATGEDHTVVCRITASV